MLKSEKDADRLSLGRKSDEVKRTSYIPPRIQTSENKEVDSSRKSLKRHSAELTPPSLHYSNSCIY